MKKTAQLTSIVFHPLFVPIYALLVLMFVASKPNSFLIKDSLFYMDLGFKKVVLILFAIFTIITPLLSMVFFKINKTISSYTLEKQNERFQPLAITACYLLFLFGFIYYELPKNYFPHIIGAIPLGGAITLALAAVVNYKLKLSLHLLGMGMWCAITYSYFQHQAEYELWVFLTIVFLSGCVATARIYLKAHRYNEIIVAFLLGFIIEYSVIYIFAYYV